MTVLVIIVFLLFFCAFAWATERCSPLVTFGGLLIAFLLARLVS